MSEFSPYIIQHLQLHEIAELKVPGQNHYFVFWCNNVPLGHLWFEKSGEITTQKDLHQQINSAIEKVVLYYFKKNTGNNELNFRQWLSESDYESLSSHLSTVLIETFDNRSAATENFSISVVICTRNRPAALGHCLEALTAVADSQVEIIVVDNAPDDDSTRKVVERYRNVRYILEKRKGLDIARNTGAQNANAEIIAYTDDDVKISPNWINVLKTCFDNPLTMAVTGLVIPLELETPAEEIFERDWGFNKGYLPQVFDHKYFLDKVKTGVPAWDVGAGANMAFRKSAFLLAGWFDERLDVGASGCSGDSEMWYRIMAEGWNCYYAPHLYVFHQHRSSMEGLQKQLFSYMRGHVSALLVQYENYGHKGNLDRLYKGFPRHFYYQLKNYLFHPGKRKNTSILTEIKGCISGWRFYQKNKNMHRNDVYDFPEVLKKEVNPTADTLVSVIITYYNHSPYLKQAIDSVFEQTHKNVEVIVVDDGPDDNNSAVREKYTGPIKYVRVEGVGLSAARNIGIQFSNGDYLVFMDADDFLYANAIEKNLYFFNLYKKAAFISGGHARVDEQGNLLPAKNTGTKWGDNYVTLLQENYIAMESTVMYRRELFFYFHFDTQLRFSEDYDLNLAIARELPVFSHDEIIAAYRQHRKNLSRNSNLMQVNTLKVLERQEKHLVTDEERAAYEAGHKNWKQFYSHQKSTDH